MATPAPDAEMTYRPGFDPDPRVALMWNKTVRRRGGVYWWTTTTPQGPAAVAFRIRDGMVRADGWGPGSNWAFSALPRLLGADDRPEGFRPDHPLLRRLLGELGGARMGGTGRWYEALATSAIGQRVVTADAGASRAALARRHGQEVPPAPVNTFPTPRTVLGLTDHDLHAVGIERSRARVLRIAATYADRLERLDGVPGPSALEWLQRLPGVGPWTSGLTVGIAGGDPDAVPIGDLHLPRMVTWALTGRDGGDDAAMLEALAPYEGHRGRVVRMVKAGGAGPVDHRPRPTRHDIRRL